MLVAVRVAGLNMEKRIVRFGVRLRHPLQHLERLHGIAAQIIQAPRLNEFGDLILFAGQQIPCQLSAVAVEVTLRDHNSMRP